MKHFIYAGIHILTLFAATSAQADAWYDKWMGIMDNIGSVPESERIETLSRVLGVGKKQALTPEESTVFNRAQSNLLAIPGHATYYQDKIESMRAEVLANAKKSEDELNAVLTDGRELANEWSYDRYCFLAFQTLQLMPSAETVAVLGHFLNDPEGRDGKSLVGSSLAGSDDSQGRSFNAMMAAMTIGNLGIEHPPYIIPGTLGATFIDAWKDWWNEVAAGKRTYRFTGSSIFLEGTVQQISLSVYERDPKARRACLAHHGMQCSVCAFDFGETYGELGEGYIHVHHLRPLSAIGEKYEVNPVTDLIPVCPNCHAMLHRQTPPLQPETLRKSIGRKSAPKRGNEVPAATKRNPPQSEKPVPTMKRTAIKKPKGSSSVP